MKTKKFKQRILAAFVLIISVVILLCFSRKNAEEKSVNGTLAISGTEAESKETALQETEETCNFPETDSEKKLPEEIVTALENGDAKFLVGVDFGEIFDYNLYEEAVKNEYCLKEDHSRDLHYLFDGKGHRFSGFSTNYSDGRKPFLGVEPHDLAFIFEEVFGEPDICEVWDPGWEETGLKTEWYFEKAVLTVYEWRGEVSRIEYRALGDAADGSGIEVISDFEKRMERRSEDEKAEAIYSWELDIAGTESRDTGHTGEITEKYLREQGFDVQVPDSIFYDEEEDIYAECYTDDKEERYCFILYMDGHAYCTVKDLSKAEKTEYLIYQCDETGNVTQETQYDAWGMRMAEASYKYYSGIPFPFLTESWNVEYEGADLCRNRKTWFPEKEVERDDKGRVETVNGSGVFDGDIQCFFRYFDTFSYRTDGKLETVLEEVPADYLEEFPDTDLQYFGKMEFWYDSKGVLKKIDYHRSDWGYGTWDQSGFINFDRQGRMVHNNYYVTHGDHSKFYFYHEEEERPRAVVSWCWGNGFEDITVYQPIEETKKERLLYEIQTLY